MTGFSGCSARVASDQTVAVLASAINSRRLMASPRAEDCIGFGKNITFWIEKCVPLVTQAGRLQLSALCQKQTLSHSIDHLVGAQLHLIGDGQSECSGGFQLNNEFKFRRLLNRQIARLLTFENSYRVKASQTISFRKI